MPRPEVNNSTVPATWGTNKRDESLWLKKLTALICPASIFTGKTRLYVQALYGRHLYTRKSGDVTAGNVTADTLTIGLVAGSPPYIMVPAFRTPGDTADWLSTATVVVPLYDAEAVYLQAAQTRTSIKSGSVSHWTSGYFGSATQVNALRGNVFDPPVYFTRFGWNAFGAENGLPAGPDTPIYDVQVVPEIVVKSLVCKAGVVQLDNFDGISQLHDPEADEATGLFKVRSGTSTRHPVVIADKLDRPIGVSVAGYAPVIVGYV